MSQNQCKPLLLERIQTIRRYVVKNNRFKMDKKVLVECTTEVVFGTK